MNGPMSSHQLRKIAFSTLHSTTKRLLHWFDILKKLKLDKKTLPRDVRTRWNSTFKMLNSANEHRAAIDSLTGNRAMGMRKCELTEEEFGIVEELRDILHVSHRHKPQPNLVLALTQLNNGHPSPFHSARCSPFLHRYSTTQPSTFLAPRRALQW